MLDMIAIQMYSCPCGAVYSIAIPPQKGIVCANDNERGSYGQELCLMS